MTESRPKPSSDVIKLDLDLNDLQMISDAFSKEANEILSDLDDHILRLESRPYDEVLLQNLFRKIHTLKGSVGAVPGGQLFGSLAHEFETLLSRLKKQKIAPSKECIEIFLHSSRVFRGLAENLRTGRELYPEELSEVIELISRYGTKQFFAASLPEGEAGTRGAPTVMQECGIWLLRGHMSSLMEISRGLTALKMRLQSGSESTDCTQALQLLSDRLQKILDDAQNVPLSKALAGLCTLVRQAASELGKETILEVKGLEISIDQLVAQDLLSILTHMVRNAMDHGIERPDERQQKGKPRQGRLQIEVEERGSGIFCKVQDDGRGLDCERILRKALENGLTNAVQARQLSEHDIFKFIFHPGFSTKEKITTISGRGVGMDVVHSLIHKYGGEVRIHSVPGDGTCFELEIPIPSKTVGYE